MMILVLARMTEMAVILISLPGLLTTDTVQNMSESIDSLFFWGLLLGPWEFGLGAVELLRCRPRAPYEHLRSDFYEVAKCFESPNLVNY